MEPQIKNGVRSRSIGAIARARYLRRTSSLSEEKLWENLRSHRVGYSFRRNHPILETWWLDFYCPAAKLCIEVDGEQHEQTQDRDAFRDAELVRAGILTIRFASLRVLSEMSAVLQEIQTLCQERTGKPPKYRHRE
jgi:very-short-patch-repair endonuclease